MLISRNKHRTINLIAPTPTNVITLESKMSSEWILLDQKPSGEPPADARPTPGRGRGRGPAVGGRQV